MKKFKLDYSFLFLFLIVLFSPKQYWIGKIFLCLVLHELGHLFCIWIFHWKVEELRLSLFGFFLKLEPKKEKLLPDFLLYFGGILANGIGYLVFPDPTLKQMNLLLICINILPIYPLDGYNLIKLLCCSVFSFYNSIKISLSISIITIIGLLVFSIFKSLDWIIFLELIYLLILNIDYIFKIPIVLHKFVLERILYPQEYSVKEIQFHEEIKKHLYKYHCIVMKLQNKKIPEETLLQTIQYAKL